MSEQERIATVLANVERPSFVKEIRYVLDNDWSGDPGVWIWVILQDDVAASQEIYIHIRGESEQAELDRAEAA